MSVTPMWVPSGVLGFFVRLGYVPPVGVSLYFLWGLFKGAGGFSSSVFWLPLPSVLGMLWCGRLPLPLPPSRRVHLLDPPRVPDPGDGTDW